MYFCHCVINIKIIHLILVRLQTTSGYVRHCSKKDGRGAQLPPAEQNHCLQCLMRGLIPHDLIILPKQTHTNRISVLSCSFLSVLIACKNMSEYPARYSCWFQIKHTRKVQNLYLSMRKKKKKLWQRLKVHVPKPAFFVNFPLK